MISLERQKLLQRLLLVSILLAAFVLRVYNLENIPNGLFTDEAARGYDAFSIAHTGADMFGEYLPLFARGFDDYTPALYTYLTVPLVFLLDLSRFSTRFPAAVIGILTVAVSYQAIRRPFGDIAGLIGAALLAVSPWYVLLSRIGTEWNTLGLGPMLTIVLAYRGLQRPKWLMAAGIIGGLSLYGYAPVKAFLPLLMLGFVIFYRQELIAQPRVTLTALILFVLLAIPVYFFSFTASGLTRFQEVAYFNDPSGQNAIYQFTRNYVSYFDPKFLFITDISQPNIFFIQRLKNVGLLYWFELPLIILGFVCLVRRNVFKGRGDNAGIATPFREGRREQYFWLYWLLIAPLGINLHVHSPKPALWLTATPTLHGLAAAGLAYLIYSLQYTADPFQKRGIRRSTVAIIIIILGLIAVVNVTVMVDDLFGKFPIYGAKTMDWGYGMDEGIKELVSLEPAFDQANLDTFGAISGIYLAYYTRFPPQQRQVEVAEYREDAWQHVGPISVGQIEARSLQPGCHISLTRSDKRVSIPAPNVLLTTYNLPDGQPSSLLLSAIASPQSGSKKIQAIFDDKILLDSFSFPSKKSGQAFVGQPGQAICIVLNWQSAGNLQTDYTVFVHLIGPTNPATGNPLWAQADSMPVEALRPTTSWQPGEVIQDMHVLFIPDDAPQAIYQLNIGLYEAVTGQRLPVQHSDGTIAEQVTLLEIDVR